MAKKKKVKEETVLEQDVLDNAEGESQDEEKEIEKTVEEELAEMKDKYIRLYSEFDNFRRRTAKERIELMGTATEGLMTGLIPVIDDFERGIANMKNAEDVKSVKQGVDLIFNKFKGVLEGEGLKPMESYVGKELDPDLHEAITQAPAPNKKLKGKIMDEIEKGYYLNDKIIRYTIVIIGA